MSFNKPFEVSVAHALILLLWHCNLGAKLDEKIRFFSQGRTSQSWRTMATDILHNPAGGDDRAASGRDHQSTNSLRKTSYRIPGFPHRPAFRCSSQPVFGRRAHQ